MIQLNPMLPLWHVPSKQPCDAFLVLDYSQEHDLMMSVIMRNGEIWTCRTSDLRGQENVTLGRGKSHPTWDDSVKRAMPEEVRQVMASVAAEVPKGHYVE